MTLHGSVGPARTTFSMVAEQAGVQRHTLYAHFPDEENLLLACSAHHLGIDPPPDPAAWASIADGHQRLSSGLGAIYAWYERNADLIGGVLRDAEHHPATRAIVAKRIEPHVVRWLAAFGIDSSPRTRAAMLRLAVSFHTWRALAREGGIGSAAAAELMARAFESTGED